MQIQDANRNQQMLVEKWKGVIDNEKFEPVTNIHKRRITAQLLENQHSYLQEVTASGNMVNQGGTNTGTFDPVLIPLVRRMAPKLIAYDICGVQAMNMPTGLIFAMRSTYQDNATPGLQTEALFNEASTSWGGANADASIPGTLAGGNGAGAFPIKETQTGAVADLDATFTYGTGMTTTQGETETWNSMSMRIEKTLVEAKTRQLKAEYSLELAQDMRSVHGLDAEIELTNILSTEIIAEINREIVRKIYMAAKIGVQWTAGIAHTTGTGAPGILDLQQDTDGRWSVERYKGLMFAIERDANVVARETRRGKGNILICGADVASALMMVGLLSNYSPNLQSLNDLVVDVTGTTYAGMINGRYKVYVDPYMQANAYVVGFKGDNAYDAGFFYCPYVPLQQFKATDPTNFQPQIGFKTRYGIVSNPFTTLSDHSNVYYRKAIVKNLM
ncbi:MAG: hypothetical protein PHC28_08955 [Flavobacterium sp.]|uniref:hypothetical protein n=1 Tax=Flavobacterium sp. TaxID=239 RepID=UPI0026228F70|nr:hypothetical protein [Flavobacterium sp.]MDD5150597.1 hypothetical protein [Flavobacterium sp.]